MDQKGSAIIKALESGRQLQQAGRLQQAEDTYRHVLQLDPRQPDALYLLGTIALQTSRYQKAIELIRQAISIQPGNPYYFYHIGLAAMALNNIAMALQAFQQAVQLKPDFPAVYNDMGVLLERTGDLNAAIESYRKAIKYKPDFSDAYYNLAGAYEAHGKSDAAIRNYEKALEHNPDDAMIYNNLGNVWRNRGETEPALEKFRKAIQLQPDFAGAYLNIGSVMEQTGDTEGAAAALEKALTFNPGYGEAYYELARITHYHEYNEDIQAMEKLLRKPDITDELRMYLNFSLGKAFEDLKQYDAAFKHIADGNRLKRSTYDYSLEEDRIFFNEIKRIFDKDFFNARRHFGSRNRSPIFILGMPRSGTTLVEQILASHPQVNGAGEVNYLRQVIFESAPQITGQHFSDYILSLDRTDIARFGNEYLERIQPYQKESEYVTNKLPLNFLYIGMIRLMFPLAKVIHCVRDPIDTCLSCFKLLFAGKHPYAYDLQELAGYYLLYQDLMSHWHAMLPDYIHDNHYEILISDQENQTKKLLDFCGLPWDERCLNFHQTKRSVRTASLGQVRRPIYDTSVAFWKHYEKHLSVLIQTLGQH